MMEFGKNIGVYVIRNTVTGARYIGGTGRGFQFRKGLHWSCLRGGRHRNKRLQEDWNTYGEAAFVFAPVELVADKADVLEREQWWLDLFWGTAIYNFGRDAAAPTRGVSQSADTVRKRAEARRGVSTGPMSEETKQKIAATKRGRKVSEETRRKLSKVHQGRVFSDATKQKLRDARKRQAPPAKGLKHSEETRQRLSEISRAWWEQKTPEQVAAAQQRLAEGRRAAREQRTAEQREESRRRRAEGQHRRWARRKQAALDAEQLDQAA